MSIFHNLKVLMLLAPLPLLTLPAAAMASQAPAASTPQARHDSSPLIDKVRAATARYRNINVALAEGFAQATPCVSGPDFGAMGVHYVLGSRITYGVLQADEPEALIYEPMPGGAQRLVGVEFIVLASVWQNKHKDGSTPVLDGHLLNYVAAPNRFGLPEFYEMHVWAWEQNPVGSFADWNSQVSCDKQED